VKKAKKKSTVKTVSTSNHWNKEEKGGDGSGRDCLTGESKKASFQCENTYNNGTEPELKPQKGD